MKRLVRARWIALAMCLMGLSHCRGAERRVTVAGLDVWIWNQEKPGDAPKPVIIFSHGFHGCGTQSRFLTEALAANGYIVFAPNHRDATCSGGASRWSEEPSMPFAQPALWNEASFRDRGEDIRRLIQALGQDPRWDRSVDWQRLALAGHSLGGYTVLGLAGGWPSWKLPGVRAVLALSPYSQPFLVQRTLGGLSAPVMYQGGTLDFGATPALQKSMGAFEQSPEPKYYVEFERVGHFAWANIGKHAAREGIVAYSLAFLNHYVKGEPADPALTRARPEVAQIRYVSELGRSGPAGKEGR
ncbi:MAG TPA: alpha/beta hydrolase [Thermoanaerobaculia bacterium]|nr:alpha/beta hydrolase [Thermoanaerobaculia bacterium]